MMYNKDKIILTDCDGVCLDWEFGFHTWMSSTMGMEIKTPHMYDVGATYGITKLESKEYVERFNSSAAMGFLPPLRDAQYYMKLIAEELGYRFIAVTSLSTDESAQKLRTCNLKKLFGNDTFVEDHYLGCGDDKNEILVELSTRFEGSMWVEDKYVNAEVGLEIGYDAILMEHGHSLNYVGDAKVMKNWKEIYEYTRDKAKV
jgi:hypothetical protein